MLRRDSLFMAQNKISKIRILPTKTTPEFIFDPDGRLIVRGRGFYSDKSEISDQILNWIELYITNPPETTSVTLAFEYLNSFSTTILVSILRKLRLVVMHSKKLIIKWYYEEDDDDILERGVFISKSFKIPIEFIPTKNVYNL